MKNNQISIIVDEVSRVLFGKEEKVLLSIFSLLTDSHLLIEDSPGVGKTTLALTLAKIQGIELKRIQFTNDMLPSDILGTMVYHKETSEFKFHKGPIFGEFVLADELNRAPAKTQSALLQAMEERRVSVDNEEYILPTNFTVVATQNPRGQLGINFLPESQVDRFGVKLSLGYTDKQSTLKFLKGDDIKDRLKQVQKVLNKDKLDKLKLSINDIFTSDEILSYIYRLLDFSRKSDDFLSLSNRCALDLLKLSRACAFYEGRDHVIPDDVKMVFPCVAGHRLISPQSSSVAREHEAANELMSKVNVR